MVLWVLCVGLRGRCAEALPLGAPASDPHPALTPWPPLESVVAWRLLHAWVCGMPVRRVRRGIGGSDRERARADYEDEADDEDGEGGGGRGF